VAKNLFWKIFENKCARDFGGIGRFPANQGGALDFETPWAIGQCKTMISREATGATTRRKGKTVKVRADKTRPSYTLKQIAKWCQEVLALTRRGTEREGKWPVVCVKVRRGVGIKSETLFCLARRAADEWIGTTTNLLAPFDAMAGRQTVETLTAAVERLAYDEPETFGIQVTFKGHRSFVAIGRSRFLKTYQFAKTKGRAA
jgi:hypothetical protein